MAVPKTWIARYDEVANYSYTSGQVNLRIALDKYPGRHVWLRLSREEAARLRADLARIFPDEVQRTVNGGSDGVPG